MRRRLIQHPRILSTRRRSRFRIAGLAVAVGLVVTSTGLDVCVSAADQAQPTSAAKQPRATDRPAPAQPRAALPEFWWVPGPADPESKPSKLLADFAVGIDLIDNGRADEALALVSKPELARTPVANYAAYYTGLAQLSLARFADARLTLEGAGRHASGSWLAAEAFAKAGEAAAGAGDHAGAVALFDAALAARPQNPDVVLSAQAASAKIAGLTSKAFVANLRLYTEFPTTEAATSAENALAQAPEWSALSPGSRRLEGERARADRLFGARRFGDARVAFERVAPLVSGDERGLVSLRIAQCDIQLRRFGAARDALTDLAQLGSRRAEARYYQLACLRGLGNKEMFVALAQRISVELADTTWAEDALNDLGSFYLVEDEDEKAAAVFRDLYSRYPQGRRADRAAWKAGWWAYRQGDFRGAIALFESASTTLPRSDYRPSFLYWIARAYQRLDDAAAAAKAFEAVIADYRFTFYGARAIKARGASRVTRPSPVPGAAPSPVQQPANLDLIRLLIGLDLPQLAERDLEQARWATGDSPALMATLAYVAQAQGDARRGITLMKRAYPQHLGQDGAALPREIQQIIFPLEHWSLIQRYAGAHKLDPYLVAALINQESTFVADIRSRANAIGLMQVLPSTGRRYARRLGIRRFAAASLTRPEINIRIGTAYFSDLVRQFGKVHLVLAAYNAGESRVKQWTAERRGLPDDEFIDDIPFPETQGYVRKVLGMADDYRRLYGPASAKRPGDDEGVE